MKKIMFLIAAMLCSISASAQFTVFEPVTVPSTPRTMPNIYDPYSVPFTVFEPVYDRPQPRVQQPKPQFVTLKGYYKKGEEWKVTPIRVMVQGDEIKLASVKSGHNWVTCNARVCEVSGFDPEIVRDNFNYKASYYMFGTIYF